MASWSDADYVLAIAELIIVLVTEDYDRLINLLNEKLEENLEGLYYLVCVAFIYAIERKIKKGYAINVTFVSVANRKTNYLIEKLELLGDLIITSHTFEGNPEICYRESDILSVKNELAHMQHASLVHTLRLVNLTMKSLEKAKGNDAVVDVQLGNVRNITLRPSGKLIKTLSYHDKNPLIKYVVDSNVNH